MNDLLNVQGNTANECWGLLLSTLINFGEQRSPRGIPTREVPALTIRLSDALSNVITIPERKLNYSFMVAEWMWIMACRDDVESIAHYCPNIAKFSDDGKRFFGAYGPRLNDQHDYIINKLRSDPDTRQAVATIWRLNPPSTKDVPCTVAMQMMLRPSTTYGSGLNQLDAIFYMRSSDAWLGIPYDIFNFTRIQSYFASQIGAITGSFTLFIGSSHIYERDIENAKNILSKYSVANLYRSVPQYRSPELSGSHLNDFYNLENATRSDPNYPPSSIALDVVCANPLRNIPIRVLDNYRQTLEDYAIVLRMKTDRLVTYLDDSLSLSNTVVRIAAANAPERSGGRG